MIIPIGSGPPPLLVRISARRAAHVRARCGVIGPALAGGAPVLGVALVVVGLRLPTSYHPISAIGVMMGALAALWLLLSGTTLTGARSSVHGGHLDVNRAGVTKRVLGALWGGAVFCAASACFLHLMILNSGPRQVPFTAGAAAYLALLAVVVLLGGVAFFTARALLDPRAAGRAPAA
ncbi:hypothetical protein [Saccharothrix algeriensis]|uniref:Uncharacterized protein n=1 Tax=Saccharothrix algeriensis TaxID=173560 RepID=A0A8T8HWR2_9PSEU|nr:hypothetical protein [Saccharothrix algeriensis]MBM7814775.1 hypothetical protein [Saccharothrix algeriensis]QTR03053.1 hypothetical protein J7S33_29420 [Saccharothrix algeriensis]